MEVIALVGPSGTGKSHRAAAVAASVGAGALVDDGLVIVAGNIVAGRSAKREATKMAAVRRAIFQRDADAQVAREVLRSLAPERVLVIGTSRSMVDRIAVRLGLPAPSRVIRIEDVAAPDEIETARHVRTTQGKHVIPAPTLQVKQGFSGYLVDPLRLLFRSSQGRPREVEKSIVRPTYSALGRFSIDDRAVAQVATIAARRAGARRVDKVTVRATEEGVRLAIDLELRGAHDLLDRMASLQADVARDIERWTALNVLGIDVTLRAVEVPRRRLRKRRPSGRPQDRAARTRARQSTPPGLTTSAGPSGPPAGLP